MLNISDLQLGTFLVHNDQPHQLIWREHSKLGRGGAILRSKIKNLLTAAIIDITFKGNDRVEEADVSRSKAQFTYSDETGYHFMNMLNFEQFDLAENIVGGAGEFLKEGIEVDVLSWNNKAININPPIKVDLKVTETEPAIRGNTAQGSVTKPAVLETGAKVLVPIFLQVGDMIRVNTETAEYVERVKS